MTSEKEIEDFKPKSKEVEIKFSKLSEELSELDKKANGSHYLSSNDLSKALYEKAPSTFIQSKSSEELIDIVKTSSECINRFLEDKSQ